MALAVVALVSCDPGRKKQLDVEVPMGDSQVRSLVAEIDKLAGARGFHAWEYPANEKFPNRIAGWVRKSKDSDYTTTLGCFIFKVEDKDLIRIEIVRFPGTSLTPYGEGLFRDVIDLLQRRHLTAKLVVDG